MSDIDVRDDLATADTLPPARSRRRLLLLLIAVVLGAAVTGVVIAAATGSRHHNSPSTLSLPPKQPVVSAGARELIAILDAGRHVTFHATYRVIGDPKVVGSPGDIEVWQAPPRLRANATQTQGSRVVRTASFVEATGGHECTQTDQQPWVCHQAAAGSSRGPGGLLSTIGNDVASKPVSTSDDTVGGRKVRCFTVGADTGSVELCATPAGIPVLIANGTVRLELVTLNTSVPSSIFSPPAGDTR